MNTSKFTKIAQRLDTLLKVLQKVSLIGITVALMAFIVLTIANAVDPNVILGEDFHEIDVGPITIILAEGSAPDNNSILIYSWILLLLGGVCAGVIYFAFGCIRKILQPVIQGNPFYPTVGKDIRKIGYVCIVLGIVDNIANITEIHNILANYGLSNLANNGLISKVSVNYNIDLTFIIIFFVVLLLSYIFEYGAQLQQLSDETL